MKIDEEEDGKKKEKNKPQQVYWQMRVLCPVRKRNMCGENELDKNQYFLHFIWHN